jgi:DNA ligase-1
LANREFLQLAHDYNQNKHSIGGWYVSEKLDGQRAYWDGGITRGVPVRDVPFANRNKDAREHVCTGLWSRYGKPIFAPGWWLDHLPLVPLDGELYIPLTQGNRQDLSSIIKQLIPDSRWGSVSFYVFESPPDEFVFQPGKINGTNFKILIERDVLRWVKKRRGTNGSESKYGPFRSIYSWLQGVALGNYAVLHKQFPLDPAENKALTQMEAMHDAVIDLGGEGLIVRNPTVYYEPKRSHNVLKVKKAHDDESIVIGYKWGKEGKEDRCLGMMGSLMVRWNGPKGTVTFDIGTGFTMEQRAMTHSDCSRPGQVVQGSENIHLPLGTKITFQYRGVTKDGIPVEARFFRKRDPE